MIAPHLKYTGAKWRLLSWLYQFTPESDRVVDVFGGSGAFSVNLPFFPAHHIYNDINGDLVNLFQVLRNSVQRQRLIELITFTPWSRDEYLTSCDERGRIIPSNDPVEDARRYLVSCWQGQRGGQATSRTGWRHRGVRGDASTTSLWQQLPARLAAVGERFAAMEIESMDAVACITRYGTSDTLIYADPPYVITTIHGTRRKRYQHEMTEEEHAVLLNALCAHPGPVLLSGYETPLYMERLGHWRCVTMISRAESGAKRTECLWLNQACQDRLGVVQEVLI